MALQCFDLAREGPGELGQHASAHLLLADRLGVSEPARRLNHCLVDRRHLRREQGLGGIARSDGVHRRDHRVQLAGGQILAGTGNRRELSQ